MGRGEGETESGIVRQKETKIDIEIEKRNRNIWKKMSDNMDRKKNIINFQTVKLTGRHAECVRRRRNRDHWVMRVCGVDEQHSGQE